MSWDAQKKAARTTAFAARKLVFDATKSGQASVLSEFLAGHRGVATAGYMPINTEISPLAAMAEQAAYGNVGVPVITGAGQPLKFAKWEPDMPMVAGEFGAKIPEKPEFFVPEIIILPLVAWDRQGNRLGYGGGFYDRTLELLRASGAVLAVGFAFDEQEQSDLPIEETDQPLNMIITQTLCHSLT